MLQITADIFSGRPNPFWVVDETEALAILDRIDKNRDVISDVDSGFKGLGYRGILLEPLTDESKEEFNLPSSFMIANGGSENEPKGIEIATELVKKMLMHPTREEFAAELAAPLNEEVLNFLLGEISSFAKKRAEEIRKATRLSESDQLVETSATTEAARVTCYIELGKYNPGFWNNNASIRSNNNCYNYGTNRRTNTYAQPGRASGKPLDPEYPHNCGDVTKAALSDGAHKRFNCFPDSEKPRYFMAMAVRPGTKWTWDYHWYRKAKEGFWGHKPGGTEVRNWDEKHKTIMDPATCDRGAYTQFCGYFYSCKSMKVK